MPAEPASGPATSTAELAVDTDYEFFLLNGSDEAATIAAVEGMLGLADVQAFIASFNAGCP